MKKIFFLFAVFLLIGCDAFQNIAQNLPPQQTYPQGQDQTYPQRHGRFRERIPTQQEFAQMLTDIKKETFTDDKMKMLKVSTGFYPNFTADQLRQLLLLFDKLNGLSKPRLETAKLIAPKVVDKNNLPSLADLFFISDKDEYLNFLQTLRY